MTAKKSTAEAAAEHQRGEIMDSLRRIEADLHGLRSSRDEHHRELADHSRRIAALEPIRPQVDRLTEHVADIGSKVGVILERLEGQESSVAGSLRVAAKALAGEVTATVRAELAGWREEFGGVRDEVRAVSTKVDGLACARRLAAASREDCPIEGKENSR